METTHLSTRCPACGCTLSREPVSAGLCPGCILELALESPSLLAELEAEDDQATLTWQYDAFSEGQILGQRYRIRALLGRGGMGEVWRATDLKLRVDVALKALHRQLLTDERALETLRQEVRVAREVVSPNVCRVFDLIELDGQELVSMEYIDGITLLDILRMRAPLDLSEAREIAAQFLAGLEAIHEAGLVHRDVKPENLMMTRSGRVVLMDFGIAKGLAEAATGTISGTPAYMSPEQARGESLDARADVFSAGVVLAEMIAANGLRSPEARQKIWQGIHQQPPALPDSLWRPVLEKAVALSREQRYPTAAALARALEEVTLRVAGAEELDPYPGLAAFTEDDAEYFFGRELEVEAMWRKLQRPHLLGLIGPSGTGKSSFLRAGLLPVMPTGWRAILLTPGNEPFPRLARTLVPELTDDTEALQLLTRSDDAGALIEAAGRWRQRHTEALIILDQFEELFTQNPQQIQDSFAELLGRLALDADIHVLLAMRDDFLAFCSHYEALAPLFSELTPLKPLTGGALRRALVQPALKSGYKFEDDALVDEMIDAVADERGALPLLAFAAARLWEHRDREQGLLTREAYEHIGGVAGALAQHAEATLERIGHDQVPIVRELLRNLVTAQGTRAARDRDELLSVFAGADRAEAERVLDALIDARLLTSYEVPSNDDDGAPRQQVEIIHESLLTHWPRLVRWQTQDADSAQLRDQLRQAAQMWIERDRPQDLLWTGTSFDEYRLWRERYEGGLSDSEESFGQAMTDKAERQKRRRRRTTAAAVALAITVAGVMGFLWRRSMAETRRAEAANLLAIAQLQIEVDPTEALAYATESLALADTTQARLFALKVLQQAPPALVLSGLGESGRLPAFSSDGRWLATAGHTGDVLVFQRNGQGPVRLSGHKASPRGYVLAEWFFDRFLITGHWTSERARIWSFPGGKLEREIAFGAPTWWRVGSDDLLAEVFDTDTATGHELYRLQRWELPYGQEEDLGVVDTTALALTQSQFDPVGGWSYEGGTDVYHRPSPGENSDADLLVASNARIAGIPTWPQRLWTQDLDSGGLALWNLDDPEPHLLRVIPSPLEDGSTITATADRSGRWAATMRRGGSSDGIELWDLESWPESRSCKLQRQASWYGSIARFDPTGNWLVASTAIWDQLVFWPLAHPKPTVVEGYASRLFRPIAFSPDSRWLATAWPDRSLRLWPLPGNSHEGTRVLHRGAFPEGTVTALSFDPSGERLVGTGSGPETFVADLDAGSLDRLEGFSADHYLRHAAAFSPSGHLVAAGTSYGTDIEKALRVWNLETGEVQILDLEQTRPQGTDASEKADTGSLYPGGIASLAFVDETTLYSAGMEGAGVIRWDLVTGAWTRIVDVGPQDNSALWLSHDGRRLLTAVSTEDSAGDSPGRRCGHLILHDIDSGATRALENLPGCEQDDALYVDRDLSVRVTTRSDGTLRVASIGGGEPHLLTGHEGKVEQVAISPDLRWIASTGEDNTLRLWPMPDLSRSPLHSLPRRELLTRLRSLTNLRAVRDEALSTGWKIEIGPFPGWENPPNR